MSLGDSCLSGCFSRPPDVGLGFIERPREILRAAYEVIGCRGAPSSKAEEGLERGHGLPPAIVAKDEFIEVNLELTAAHAVIGSNEPLLQIANSAVRLMAPRISRPYADRFSGVECEGRASTQPLATR